MTKKSIIKTEKALAELREKTAEKIWQYAVLSEFIRLFENNNSVLNFIYSKFYLPKIGIIDDRIPLTPAQLKLYEQNKEPSLEQDLQQLLDIK